LGQENFRALFNDHKHLRLFGEWLVPHFFKGYSAKAWRKFYIFDVMVFDERYLPYMEYSAILSKYNVEFIPPICSIDNPSYERLVGLLDKNYYLIDDGGEPGEGIVIKNYNYRNKFGRQTWAKLVRNEFKTLHAKFQVTELTEKKMVEQEIVDKYVTEALVNKEYEKIKAEDGWSSKLIPRLLNTVYYCLITEESWNFIKDHKNPIINYRTLNFLTINKIKALMPQLF
jgi:Fe-S cluster biosynthesis and repair protein YggX